MSFRALKAIPTNAIPTKASSTSAVSLSRCMPPAMCARVIGRAALHGMARSGRTRCRWAAAEAAAVVVSALIASEFFGGDTAGPTRQKVRRHRPWSVNDACRCDR